MFGTENLFERLGIKDNLTESSKKKILRENPIVKTVISKWQGTVDIDRMYIDSWRSEKYKNDLLKFIIEDLHFEEKIRQIIELVYKDGSCVVRILNGLIVVDKISYYSQQLDFATGEYIYTLNYNGKRITNLRDGVEIWVCKDWVNSADKDQKSRLDSLYYWLELYYYGIKSNAGRFKNGFVGDVVFPVFDTTNEQIVDKVFESGDKENKILSWSQKMTQFIIDKFTGHDNANRVGIIPGLKDFISPDKSNRDLQTLELLKECLVHIALGSSMSPVNLGVGDNTTYNNVEAMNHALHDSVGQNLQGILADLLNHFIIPSLGIRVDGRIKFTAPVDPNKILRIKEYREDAKAGLITINEYRSKRGFDPIQGGDITLIDKLAVNTSTTFSKFTDVDSKKKYLFAKKSTFETNLNSAFDKQIEYYKEKGKLKPLETFYPFKTFKEDLIKFTDKGIKSFANDKNVKFKNVKLSTKTTFAKNDIIIDGWGDYPDFIRDGIENRTFWLLKGAENLDENLGLLPEDWKSYRGLDEETSNKIDSLIADNTTLGEQDLIDLIVEKLKDLKESRLQVIVRTERFNAVESSRALLYSKEFGKHEVVWHTADDSRVRESHKLNDEVKVWFGDSFPSGETRTAQLPRCRCYLEHLAPEDY